jgi:hypothetical protein
VSVRLGAALSLLLEVRVLPRRLAAAGDDPWVPLVVGRLDFDEVELHLPLVAEVEELRDLLPDLRSRSASGTSALTSRSSSSNGVVYIGAWSQTVPVSQNA